MSSERTEQATPKRREDARKEGRVARSPKFSTAAGFLVGLVLLNGLASFWAEQAIKLFYSIIPYIKSPDLFTIPNIHKILIECGYLLATLTLPIIAGILIVELAANLMQGGLLLSTKSIKFHTERLNPVANIKRVFGSQGFVELFKNILEFSALIAACYGMLKEAFTQAPVMIGLPAPAIAGEVGQLTYKVGFRAGAIMLLFAGLDYGYKWYLHEKSLKMTKQEIKDEFRQQEGDPMVRQQRRRMARAMVQRRSMGEVPNADMVITNPTHFAVALKYDREKHAAPIVVAKGADLLAKRIRELATENDISIIENPPLARALFKAVEPGHTIPPEFFRAVAELLAYVYRQKQLH